MLYKYRGTAGFLVSTLMLVSVPAEAKDLWVSKQGSDANNCTQESTAECSSIQKAISLAGPGDTVHVKSGTYVEDGTKSAYGGCTWMNGHPVSLCMTTSGTKDRPITLQAAKGHEGKVIVDSQGERVGGTNW